jgi:PAS domain S-box-containing protein
MKKKEKQPDFAKETLKLIHELEVHQEELKTQNESLRIALLDAQDAIELFDLAPTGYFTLSREGEILKVNRRGSQILGREAEALLYCRFGLFISDGTKVIFKHFLAAIFNNQTKETCEVELSSKDNPVKYIQLVGAAGKDHNQCWITVIDITDRKHAEIDLKESESHYRNLIEKLPDGVYKSTHDGKFVAVNPALVNILGYANMEELMAIDIKTQLYFSPEDRESVILKEQLKETGIYRMKKKDGSEVWVEDHGWLTFDETTNILYHEGIMMDVTERLKTEKTLKENEKKYRDLFENAQEGIFQTRVDGSYLSVNPALARMYGFDSPEELIRTRTNISTDTYFKPDDRANFLQMMEEFGVVEGWEYEVKHKDGHKIWLYEDAKAIKDENGIIRYFEGFVVDITERKRAESELKKLNETLEERIAERTNQLEIINEELTFHLNELEQFAYITNHDLQEPLRTLTHFTQIIKEEYAGKLDTDGNKYLDFIYSSASRMKELVNGLFEYSLLGKKSIKTTVDCNQLVHAVLVDLTDSIQGSQAQITVQELPVINGYETELRLLFQNLLTNAIKFKNKDKVPVISVSAENAGKEWHFVVKDNGIGIEQKHNNKIFIIFQRLHNRRDYEGTGIGLAHCKKIVEMHGGKIWVESVPHAGSEFKFTIPK